MSSFVDSLSPSKTAILLIEYQNDFTTVGGTLHEAVSPCLSEIKTLENTLKVIDIARSKGYKVIHAPITFTDDYREIASDAYGILAGVKTGKSFLASGWGGEFNEKIKPTDNEIVVSGKRGLCGFASTNLDFILRQNGIENLAIAGFLTNCCIESTMRTAYEKGYHVITLTDCCAATSVEAHEAAVKFTFPMFSIPITADEFIQKL